MTAPGWIASLVGDFGKAAGLPDQILVRSVSLFAGQEQRTVFTKHVRLRRAANGQLRCHS